MKHVTPDRALIVMTREVIADPAVGTGDIVPMVDVVTKGHVVLMTIMSMAVARHRPVPPGSSAEMVVMEGSTRARHAPPAKSQRQVKRIVCACVWREKERERERVSARACERARASERQQESAV